MAGIRRGAAARTRLKKRKAVATSKPSMAPSSSTSAGASKKKISKLQTANKVRYSTSGGAMGGAASKSTKGVDSTIKSTVKGILRGW